MTKPVVHHLTIQRVAPSLPIISRRHQPTATLAIKQVRLIYVKGKVKKILSFAPFLLTFLNSLNSQDQRHSRGISPQEASDKNSNFALKLNRDPFDVSDEETRRGRLISAEFA